MAPRPLATLFAAGAAMCLLVLPVGRPLLVYNATASVPVGFYAVLSARGLRAGDLVLVRPPCVMRQLADERGYLPASVPLAKPVAALGGAFVCGRGNAVYLEDHRVAVRRLRDGQGRPLPGWTGCRRLESDELFLLAPSVPDSFDSRYFGPVRGRSVIGRLVPVWLR